MNVQLRGLSRAPTPGRFLPIRSVPSVARPVSSKLRAVAASRWTAAGLGEPLAKLPAGFHEYETMLILKPTLTDEERDRELARFEAYLNKEGCYDINSLVRGRHRLAYPMKREEEGVFVLYTYTARRPTARSVQLLLSTPEAGAEDTLLRHITVCKR